MRKLETGEVIATFILGFLIVGWAQSEIDKIYKDVVNWMATSNNPKWYVRVTYHVVIASSATFVTVLVYSFISSRLKKNDHL